jgi:murein DD-endopeptidase MepM/ murein hydrolase activator NlpD
MRALLKFLLALVAALAVAACGAWIWAGRQAGPAIDIRQPLEFVGQSTALALIVETPGGRFSRIDVTVEQDGRSFPSATFDQPADGDTAPARAEQFYVMHPIGKEAIPDLREGSARIVVRAARPLLFGLREAVSTVSRDVQVRLEPPRLAVLSSKHYVNQGGAEFVVYRASPADVDSWVRVGDVSYPGFEATGAGIPGDGTTRVAFFALLHDQDLQTPITIVARDAAGNEASTALDRTAFPKSFAKSRIAVTDGFLGRVVPPILAATPDLHVSSDPADLVAAYVTINSDLRQTNGKTIAEQALKTSPTMLWAGAFQQLGNSQVESRFADRRTYVHEGLDIDYQVHLGFDLAVTANVPIAAAQSGTVLLARYLGIYGNCVILDHGLGVQSLYGHLSSIDVAPGARVEQGQALGRSGMTGLAGGDHLHFTMLVGGQAVNPVEWWDPKWMQDRVLRKITEAGGTPPVTP